MHFVHFNTKCGRSFADVMTDSDCGNSSESLAVLAVMIEEGHENPHFNHILDGKIIFLV